MFREPSGSNEPAGEPEKEIRRIIELSELLHRFEPSSTAVGEKRFYRR